MSDTADSLDGDLDPEARPHVQERDPRTRGGQPQEGVEDRPSVGQVSPEDYLADDRAGSAPAPDSDPMAMRTANPFT